MSVIELGLQRIYEGFSLENFQNSTQQWHSKHSSINLILYILIMHFFKCRNGRVNHSLVRLCATLSRCVDSLLLAWWIQGNNNWILEKALTGTFLEIPRTRLHVQSALSRGDEKHMCFFPFSCLSEGHINSSSSLRFT